MPMVNRISTARLTNSVPAVKAHVLLTSEERLREQSISFFVIVPGYSMLKEVHALQKGN
jgi:hypothetical protein